MVGALEDLDVLDHRPEGCDTYRHAKLAVLVGLQRASGGTRQLCQARCRAPASSALDSAGSAQIVFSIALEALPHERRGFVASLERGALAALLGVAGCAVTFLAAGLGYYLEYRPFG